MTTLALAPPDIDPTAPRHGRDLVDPALFARLAARVAHDHPEHAELAERIADQALAFLGACADRNSRGLVPSPLVDHGWHTFILFTRDYAAFCARVCGRFIHHIPVDPAADDRPTGRQVATIGAIRTAGFEVDLDLWRADGKAKCHPCHEQGCSSTGKDGNENRDSQNPTEPDE